MGRKYSLGKFGDNSYDLHGGSIPIPPPLGEWTPISDSPPGEPWIPIPDPPPGEPWISITASSTSGSLGKLT